MSPLAGAVLQAAALVGRGTLRTRDTPSDQAGTSLAGACGGQHGVNEERAIGVDIIARLRVLNTKAGSCLPALCLSVFS